jgi:hypothetical protein
MKFKLRKLCSSTEDYELNAESSIDLDLIATNLSFYQGIEVVQSGPFLTILFEDLKVVIKLFPSGRGVVQANLREEAEQACQILSEVAWRDDDIRVNSGK